MTETETLEQARLRWGPTARLLKPDIGSTMFRVGFMKGSVYWLRGWGRSWDEAIAHADWEPAYPGEVNAEQKRRRSR